jgi:hypothetical protein
MALLDKAKQNEKPAAQKAQAPSHGQVSDTDLTQIVQGVESAEMQPEMRDSYQRVVTAGMKLVWSAQFDEERERYLDQIQQPQDVPQIIAHGVVKIISIVQNESKSKSILIGVGPASTVLMCQILEYVQAKKGIDITPELIAQTALFVHQGLMHMYQITPEVLEKVQQHAKGQGAQPQPGAQPPAQPAAPPPTQQPDLKVPPVGRAA